MYSSLFTSFDLNHKQINNGLDKDPTKVKKKKNQIRIKCSHQQNKKAMKLDILYE